MTAHRSACVYVYILHKIHSLSTGLAWHLISYLSCQEKIKENETIIKYEDFDQFDKTDNSHPLSISLQFS